MLGHDTRFQPGQSGNPGGRKPIPEELKNRLRNLSEKAVDALEQALDSKDDRVRIHAATVLLDRAYGKPAQQHDVDVKQVDFAQAHLAALVEAAKKRVAQRERERAEAAGNADAAAAGTALVLHGGRCPPVPPDHPDGRLRIEAPLPPLIDLEARRLRKTA